MKVIKNPEWSEEQIEAFKKKIKDNDGYCPCALAKTPDTKCMCKEFREMIRSKTPGECHCGLHVLVES